ncbi:MAG: GNAT family N-acetyltransferase [Zoogloeaceae bacterium]|jgi:ribosomal protein S18 acetylase RimI-like enzyme|nr:GNAT family N-acetyltransferase [Zoogloeaceae bacterium]
MPAPQKNAFSIVPMTEAALPEIARLARAIWLDAYTGIVPDDQIEYMLAQRYSWRVLSADLRHPDKWLFQVEADGQRIGFVCCELCKGEFKVDKLYLLPAYQRRGIGGKLLDHAENLAREKGYDHFILAVNKGNTRAIAAYEKHGLRTRDATQTPIGGGFIMDDYIMERRWGQ